jgi:hypothetical protein
MREEDFKSLDEYNDYLETREDISEFSTIVLPAVV